MPTFESPNVYNTFSIEDDRLFVLSGEEFEVPMHFKDGLGAAVMHGIIRQIGREDFTVSSLKGGRSVGLYIPTERVSSRMSRITTFFDMVMSTLVLEEEKYRPGRAKRYQVNPEYSIFDDRETTRRRLQ